MIEWLVNQHNQFVRFCLKKILEIEFFLFSCSWFFFCFWFSFVLFFYFCWNFIFFNQKAANALENDLTWFSHVNLCPKLMEDNEIALKYKEIEGQGGNCQKKKKKVRCPIAFESKGQGPRLQKSQYRLSWLTGLNGLSQPEPNPFDNSR